MQAQRPSIRPHAEDTRRQFNRPIMGKPKRGCVFRRADPRHIIVHNTTECGRGKEQKWCSDLVKGGVVKLVEIVGAKSTSQGTQLDSLSPKLLYIKSASSVALVSTV
jgi:hypothetical protein